MSYDLTIWSLEPVEFPHSLPGQVVWRVTEMVAACGPSGWQVVVNASEEVDREDVPAEASDLLPGIRYITEINLEPLSAPQTAHKLAKRVARYIAKATTGVVEDPQEDTFVNASGTKRISGRPRSQQMISVLRMAWAFWHPRPSLDQFYPMLLETLKRTIPEALPRRYGLWEPLPHKYNRETEEELLQFLRNNSSEIIWQPTYPVVGASVRLEKQLGWVWNRGAEENEFRINVFEFEFDAAILDSPGWDRELSRFWRSISHLLAPFFGEVRILRNQIWARGSLWWRLDLGAPDAPEPAPFGFGWWDGPPKNLGLAAVFGQPYRSAWPRCEVVGDLDDELCFISTEDWQSGATLRDELGPVPEAVRCFDLPGWIENQERLSSLG